MRQQPWLAFLVLGLLLVMPVSQASGDEPDHLVSVLTSSSDETQMMSLILTSRNARAGGSAAASTWLGRWTGGDGIECGLPAHRPSGYFAAPDAGTAYRQWGNGPGLRHFLPNRAVDTGDLRDGVTVAKPGAMVDAMQREDVRLFTN